MPRKPMEDPEKYCERCGARLYRKRYGDTLEDMTRFLSRKYCSLHCANLRGIHGKNSTSQHMISRQYRKDYCERCGDTPSDLRQLHVHHKNGDWMDHREENLETLCIKCHLSKAHSRAKKCLFCEAKSRRHGMCQKHFQRWKKYGDPFLTKLRKAGHRNAYELTRIQS